MQRMPGNVRGEIRWSLFSQRLSLPRPGIPVQSHGVLTGSAGRDSGKDLEEGLSSSL